MKSFNINDFFKGWFIGSFSPSIHKTDDFEVALHKHSAGCETIPHLHKLTTECTLIVKGKLRVGEKILFAGDMWIYEPNEISDVEFLEDSELIVIRWPSIPGDKYNIKGEPI